MIGLTLATMIVATSSLPQGSCPADHPDSHTLSERFLSRSAYTQDRQELGLTSYTPVQVRVLTDPSDTAVCQHFVSLFGASGTNPEWFWTAYEVGGYYLVAFRRPPPAEGFRLAFTPLHVFDKSFAHVRSFAM